MRIATLTAKGRALHDKILQMALERERALLSVLSQPQRETLLRLLRRVHENLPAVEVATTAYIASRYPGAAARRSRAAADAAESGAPRLRASY